MKITKGKLKPIIKEEIARVTTEGYMTKMSDEDVKLKGYQDALAKRKRDPHVGKTEVGLKDLYHGMYDMGLKQLLDQGDISQEEYNAHLGAD